jgi:hypothetical protein
VSETDLDKDQESPEDLVLWLMREARAGNLPKDPKLGAALTALDGEMTRLAGTLKVEHLGPGVGMADMKAEHVYRLVVRHHVWDTTTAGWGLKICDALDNNDLRPMWPVQGVGRLRRQQLVAALPEFFRGYAAAVAAAGKADTPAGRRVMELAGQL